MRQPWSQYKNVVVETYTSKKSGRSKIRVRPVLGEEFPQSMVVECSKSMRESHPIGTRYRIYAKETDREDGKSFLYSSYKWPYEVVE